MQDLIFIGFTFGCFGIGHAYITACDRLKPRPYIDARTTATEAAHS